MALVFDAGTHFDFEASKSERLVFNTSFHHMDCNGFYDGWTEHSIIVTPSFNFGIRIKITGRDRNQFKDYAYETFDYILTQGVEEI